ncbi:MAG: DUF4292 domain-containing protein [Planctomycetes bacterium]|nr:DUF4292 domain-containing protein [Planctomycetota bacterium]
MKRALLILAVAVLAAGCHPRTTGTPRITYKSIDREALLAAYNRNAAAIRSLSAELDMTIHYVDNNKAARRGVKAWLDLEKPAHLSLRHDALGRELFYVLSDGRGFWIALDGALSGEGDVVYTGSLDALKGNEYLLRPDRLLDSLSLPALPPAGTAVTVFEEHRDKYIFSFLDASSDPRLLARAVFSRVDLRLCGYEIFDTSSRLALGVDYASYKSLPQAEVPCLLGISWPLDDVSVSVKARRIKMDRKFSPRLWEFRWRSGARTVSLTDPSTGPTLDEDK